MNHHTDAASLQTPRTQLHRTPKRGAYDPATIYAILDEAFVCHIGFAGHGGTFVIPTVYGRKDDLLYVHGSAASRMMKTLGDGVDLCLTVTLLDGLVLAKSAYHHSVNFRSVVILGKAQVVEGEEEKAEALRLFTEHIMPGRFAAVRPPAPQELKATTVLSLKIEEASAKIRTGPPLDDEADLGLDVWSGVIPIAMQAGDPIPEADSKTRPAPGGILRG